MDDERGNTLEFEGICHYVGLDTGAYPTQNFITLNIDMELLDGTPYSAPRRFGGNRHVRITIVDLTDEEETA